MALEFIYTKSREAFFKTVDETLKETEQRLRQDPTFTILETFAIQLVAIKNFTAHGRKPSLEERRSITLGRLAYREFEGTNDLGWADYQTKVSEISSYFKLWLSDKGLAEADPNDWRLDFPDDEDLSDEPG